MKKFEIPVQFQSALTGKLKLWRRTMDPRKKDLSPSVLSLDKLDFILPRHMGFCYGVENAIEIAFKAVAENPGRRVYLLGEMIHNPAVNRDLQELGVQFIMDTTGKELLDWNTLSSEDTVITPAFGTTLEIEQKLSAIGVDVKKYNTTCPFVEKVWKRSAEIGSQGFTIVIHGKYKHEETRATFSHARQEAKSVVVRDMAEAQKLALYIQGLKGLEEFQEEFAGKYSPGFNPHTDFERVGVVNQTTMLATETEEISNYLRSIVEARFGTGAFADTRDTLCYATNDNQEAAQQLLQEQADLAVVIGGHNSSNTYQLATIVSKTCPTYFVENANDILSRDLIRHLNLGDMSVVEKEHWLPNRDRMRVILISGASCPDTLVDEVMNKIANMASCLISPEEALKKLMSEHE